MSLAIRYLALLPLFVITACQQPVNYNPPATQVAQAQPTLLSIILMD